MNKIIYLLLLLYSQHVFAQQQTFSGTVTSNNKQPLEGVTVQIKNQNISAVTNKEGRFKITTAVPHPVFIFSHIGYKRFEITTTTTTINVVLEEDAVTMKAVTVSTGYQEIKQSTATGSYSKMDNELYNYKTGSDVLGRMDGLLPSVLFDKRNGATNDIKIRGLSTLGFASTAPLIVVDNFPYEGDINNINPNDVESITVLKDAAASSIWGIKAANGVIVITTKKGQYNQPLRVSVNANISLLPKPDLFAIPKMSTSDFIDVEKYLFDKGFYNADISNTSTRPPLTPVVEILAKQRSGLLSATDAASQIDALRNVDVRNDFEKYLYRESINQQYAISMNGGNRNNKYYLSGGYDKSLSNLVGNSNDRITFKAENTLMPFKNFQVTLGAGFTQNNAANNSPSGYGDISVIGGKELYPYAQLATADGTPLPINNLYRGSYTDTAGLGKLLDWKYRPLVELHTVDKEIRSAALIANIGMRYDVAKWLSAEIKYQYQDTHGTNQTNYSVNSFAARNLINEFSQVSGNTVKYIVPYGGILDQTDNQLKGYALRGQINVNKQWAKHTLNAIAGAEVNQTELQSSSNRTYGYDDKLNYTNVDYVNAYPTYGNIGGTLNIINNNGFSDLLDRSVSLYANAAYTYNNLYTVSASIRKDESNLFGVKANQRGVPLWSAGAAWNISKERFYRLHILPDLHLRMSYGYGGNVSSSISALTTILYSPASDQPIINVPFAIVQNNPNPNLRWEKAGIFNAAIDFGFINERVTGTVEYFHKNINNLLGTETLDPTVGFTSLVTNSAVMNGHGVDINVTSKNVQWRGFAWETNIFFSLAKNTITKYLLNTPNLGYVSNGANISPLQGYEPYSIVSYKWGGLDSTGNPIGFVNGLSSKDYTAIVNNPLPAQVVSGPALAPYFGGFRNTFSWKGFSASVNITGRFGFYFRREALNYSALFINNKGNAEYASRWQKSGDENFTNVPVMIYPRNANRETFYQYSEATVEKGDHIRLEDIRLAYETGKNLFNKIGLHRIQVYAVFSNLNVLLWRANKMGIDPLYPSGVPPVMRTSIGIKTEL